MTLEKSHGKARATLPRSSDLRPVETVADPAEGRGTGGRFASGNRIAQGQRWKASIRKLLGRGATTEEAEGLARESFRIYLALLRSSPSDGPSVRTLVALQARHVVLSAHWATRAADLGLETEEGTAADERALRHGQRAERLAVTSLDIATRMAQAKPRKAAGTFLRALSGAPAPRGAALGGEDDSRPVEEDESASAGRTEAKDEP